MTEIIKRKVGRPKYEPNDHDRTLAISMAAVGMSHDYICERLKISDETLRKYYGPELRAAAAENEQKVADTLFYLATVERNVTAAIFLAKTRLRWREVERVEVTGKDGGPIQHVDAPKQETYEEWTKRRGKSSVDAAAGAASRTADGNVVH